MLSGKEIAREVDNGRIKINPYTSDRVGPNSYDLRLSRQLKVYRLEFNPWGNAQQIQHLDTKEENATEDWFMPDDGLILVPNQLYLGHTVEIAGSNYYVPCIEGRSSIARLGVQVHMTAGFGDIGFIGQWTLEIQVAHPVKLYPDMRVCQIYFHQIIGDYDLYNGKYKNSKGVIPSRIREDIEFNNG